MSTFTLKSAASYHGFTWNGEVELDVYYNQTGRFSKKKLKELIILLINGGDRFRPHQVKDIRLTDKNTRIDIRSLKNWLKVFIKVRG